jgi:hypothetical protein
MRPIPIAIVALCLAGSAPAQQLKLNLDALAAKASNKIDISLTAQTLQLAAAFLGSDDADEAQVKKLIQGLEGIYVRRYVFGKENAWSPADMESVRAQLKGPEWSRIVGLDGSGANETAEVHVRSENKKITGVAILALGPREVTVVNIVGPVDLDSLAQLSGHFSVPKLGKTGSKSGQPQKKSP